ncbi:GAF domain-containing protein [Jannaschia formosa]|uniref:GAF domain-containing protein n=1 Tax=Jannaschia formosa TaxID=2259592 RepID=UPI000E1B6D4D|nr:GAF domain-containing protein [Jannaschia formosa]TFL15956.1 GAF domain-containing protein [Jannaschia formosa]
MKAKTHPLEPERLQALHFYDVLDTDREAEFDDVVQLAARLCNTEIAVINLIDAERQWFKAEVGLGVRETPLDTSLCAHVILTEEFVEIPDTLQDPRMSDNPLCRGDDGLRFYAGALLMSDGGLPIGTLCVLDRSPRTLTTLQHDALRVLAQQVINQLNLRRALRSADVLRQEVDHRVKNSFQLAASMVRLQASATSSEEAKAALDVVRGRI